jgi:hypothetical protein
VSDDAIEPRGQEAHTKMIQNCMFGVQWMRSGPVLVSSDKVEADGGAEEEEWPEYCTSADRNLVERDVLVVR